MRRAAPQPPACWGSGRSFGSSCSSPLANPDRHRSEASFDHSVESHPIPPHRQTHRHLLHGGGGGDANRRAGPRRHRAPPPLSQTRVTWLVTTESCGRLPRGCPYRTIKNLLLLRQSSLRQVGERPVSTPSTSTTTSKESSRNRAGRRASPHAETGAPKGTESPSWASTSHVKSRESAQDPGGRDLSTRPRRNGKANQTCTEPLPT